MRDGKYTQEAEANYRLNELEYGRGETELKSLPYLIQIGADNRCNLRCGFCLAAAYREAGEVHIQDRKLDRNPIELFERLIPFMASWKYLSLTGPGESLINPKLPQILELVRRHSDCTILVTTSGVLIKERMAAVFIEQQLEEVSISLDSLDKKTYEELRVNARFEDAIGAIRILNQEKARSGSDLPRISLTPNFTRKNIHELPRFIEFAGENGIANVQATPTQIYRRDWVEESLLHYPKLTRQLAEKAEQMASSLGVNFINGLRLVYLNRDRGWLGRLRRSESLNLPTDPSLCLKPWNSIYVEPDGEVRPCCYQSPVYGNLYDADLLSIWNGSEAVKLRRSMLAKDPPQLCRECYEFNRHDPSIMIKLDAVPAKS